jgi:hypothetical protein
MVSQPVEPLMKAVARGGAAILDVPVAVPQSDEAWVGPYLCCIHGLRQLLIDKGLSGSVIPHSSSIQFISIQIQGCLMLRGWSEWYEAEIHRSQTWNARTIQKIVFWASSHSNSSKFWRSNVLWAASTRKRIRREAAIFCQLLTYTKKRKIPCSHLTIGFKMRTEHHGTKTTKHWSLWHRMALSSLCPQNGHNLTHPTRVKVFISFVTFRFTTTLQLHGYFHQCDIKIRGKVIHLFAKMIQNVTSQLGITQHRI